MNPSASPDPFQLFEAWYHKAQQKDPTYYNAAILATVSSKGAPSSRVILVKEVSSEGFCFYTNSSSRKARELTANPRASLLFFWPSLEMQVRIEGKVEPIAREKSEAYFHSRPRKSQIAAWASEQSAELSSRQFLLKRFAQLEQHFQGESIPMPPFWGGYRLRPNYFEFWKAGKHRLHDRLVYLSSGNTWTKRLLFP